MKSLEKLNLENNEIAEVADLVYALNNLNYLDLSNNQLTRISPKISALELLQNAHSYDEKLNKHGLWVIGNPLIIPPKEVWQTNNLYKIYDFLSGYAQKNLNYTYYAQLLFVGCSGVGKSKLIDTFFNNQNDHELNSKTGKNLAKFKIYRQQT
jgi:Leucine-rich repeat (LRR) protein